MTKKVFVYGKYISFEIPKPIECDYELITEELIGKFNMLFNI